MVQPPYPISSIPEKYVDHVGMRHLFDYCSQEGAKVALIGFNECAKHLVNMCGNNIVGIYEQAEGKLGINFRGKRVVGLREMLEINRIAVCDRLLGLDFADQVSLLYDEKIPVYMPPSLDGTSAAKVQPFEQEKFYKDLISRVRRSTPVDGRPREDILPCGDVAVWPAKPRSRHRDGRLARG